MELGAVLAVVAKFASIIAVLLSGSAIVVAIVRRGHLGKKDSESAIAVPIEDYSLLEMALKSGNEEAIEQYVRLRNLTGLTGTLTRLGLTGFPIATVMLTIVFAILSMISDQTREAFLDLTKIMMGAFVGSFVQGAVQRTDLSRSPKPPPSEKISPPDLKTP